MFLKTPLAADYPDADTSNWSSAPRPHVTAYQGADLDAYWYDESPDAGAMWRHCQTGRAWTDCGGDLVTGGACGACLHCQAQARLLP